MDLLLGCKFLADMFVPNLGRQAVCLQTVFGKIIMGQQRESLPMKDTEQTYSVCLNNEQLHEALLFIYLFNINKSLQYQID